MCSPEALEEGKKKLYIIQELKKVEALAVAKEEYEMAEIAKQLIIEISK